MGELILVWSDLPKSSGFESLLNRENQAHTHLSPFTYLAVGAVESL